MLTHKGLMNGFVPVYYGFNKGMPIIEARYWWSEPLLSMIDFCIRRFGWEGYIVEKGPIDD